VINTICKNMTKIEIEMEEVIIAPPNCTEDLRIAIDQENRRIIQKNELRWVDLRHYQELLETYGSGQNSTTELLTPSIGDIQDEEDEFVDFTKDIQDLIAGKEASFTSSLKLAPRLFTQSEDIPEESLLKRFSKQINPNTTVTEDLIEAFVYSYSNYNSATNKRLTLLWVYVTLTQAMKIEKGPKLLQWYWKFSLTYMKNITFSSSVEIFPQPIQLAVTFEDGVLKFWNYYAMERQSKMKKLKSLGFAEGFSIFGTEITEAEAKDKIELGIDYVSGDFHSFESIFKIGAHTAFGKLLTYLMFYN
jgi:hypothetical protein